MDSGMKKCMMGAFCLCVWELSQATFVLLRPAYEYFYQAAVLSESGYLLIAAFFLVLMNALRAVILYNGWFLIGEGAAEKTRRKSAALLLPLVMIPLSYLASDYFSNYLHFGVPALLTLSSVVCIQTLCRDVTRPSYKLLIQSFLIFSIQWLDLIPFLTPYGFGWGEWSLAVKELSVLVQRDDLLNLFSSSCFAWFFGTSALLAALFLSYDKRLRQLGLIRKREQELARLRREQLEARLYQEIHYLVHDLRRPLTSVIGLADLLSLSPDGRTAEYGANIAAAAKQMDQMISEIRNPAAVREVTVKELLNYAMAQARPLKWGPLVRLECGADAAEGRLAVNLIRVSRALVNLLDNAHRAVSGREVPCIVCGASRSGCRISVYVEDNGPGFVKPPVGELSGWGSSGQGLRFVRETAEANGAEFSMRNRDEGGLRCELIFPEAGKK